MKDLLQDIKQGLFKRAYLFYGAEQYLIHLYERRVREKVISPAAGMMNMDVFEGKSFAVSDVENAVNTLPFLSEHRLVILRNTGLLAPGRKDDSEKMTKLTANLPDDVILLFIESDVDKRGRLYKEIARTGRAVDFKTPGEKELADWVCRSFKSVGKMIAVSDALFLLRMVAQDMSAVEGEIAKLADYCGKADCVTRADIEHVCTKSPVVKIFDMIGAIGDKNPEEALDIFNNLLVMKESPVMVISMIARQFRLMLQSRLLQEQGLPPDEIAVKMGQKSFIVRECMRQGQRFSVEALKQALADCLEADLSIKTGKMNDKLAVEVLILKYT